MLAVVVHMALLAFLWVGIRWQNETPLAVEAEIWDPQVREAAPLPPPVVEPEPEPPKPTPPIPTPVVKAPPPPPKVEETPVAKPDIALEKEKKEQKRKELEKERKEQEKEKEKEAKLEREKADKLKKDKQEAEQKLAKQKDDADAKKKAEADKLAAEKRQKQQAADSKAAEQRRQDDLKRMMSQAGGTGDAAKSQGPRGDPGYANKIAAKIRSNTTGFEVPAGLAGNPAVEYAVELLPDGSVRGIRKTRSSNVPGFDEAVARAIEKSQPFPPDKDGKVPPSINVIHKPKDQ